MPITKKDVDLSMQSGDSRTSDQILQEQLDAQLALAEARDPAAGGSVPVLPGEYVIFKLVHTDRRGAVNVDGIDDVIHPVTGQLERIRLLRGVSSIWMKDQKDLTEAYIRENRRTLRFESKICKIPKWDTPALEFARLCRSFVESATHKKMGSRHPFYEYNPARLAQENLKRDKLRMQAIGMALQLTDMEQLSRHAYYLGVQPNDEFGIPKPEEMLRVEYCKKAEQDPQRFLDSYQQPIVEITFQVKKALMENKVDLARSPGAVYWAPGGGLIGHIPHGQTAQQYLVELALLPNKEGKKFLQELNRVMA